MRYRVQTTTGIDKIAVAYSPIEAIKTLSDKKLDIQAVQNKAEANVMVTLMDGQKKSVNAYFVKPSLDGKQTNITKYDVLNNVIKGLEQQDAYDFVEKNVDFSDKEEIKVCISRGFLPFLKTPFGMVELDFNDGRVELAGTSMGGSYELYYKIHAIKDLLVEKTNDVVFV